MQSIIRQQIAILHLQKAYIIYLLSIGAKTIKIKDLITHSIAQMTKAAGGEVNEV